MKVSEGLRVLSKRELLPEGEYRLKIERVGSTADGTGENAHCVILQGPDVEVRGKKVILYLGSQQANLYIGLSQLLASLQLLRVPDGEHGEGDTHNLEGLDFGANIVVGLDKKTGLERNYVNPIYDAEWYNQVMSQQITEETPKKRGRGRR